jgi:hypothetical protein
MLNVFEEAHGPTHGFYKDPMAIRQLPHLTSTPPAVSTDYWGLAHHQDTGNSNPFSVIKHPSTDLTANASGVAPTFNKPVPFSEKSDSTEIGNNWAVELNLYQQRFLQPQLPLAYANGMMFTSKCYQCCNSGFNCNANWHPSNEYDWSFNDIRGHRYNEDTDKLLMRPEIAAGTGAGEIKNANGVTNTPTFLTFLSNPNSNTG